jgi:hypothetical protein
MRCGLRVVAFVVAAVLLAASTLAFSQSATTSLRGTVFDPKGAVVSGATLTITNSATGFSRTTKSDSQGGYQFLEMPPAKYDLAVDASGFGTLRQSGV